ncbi:MAG: aminopeptidase P N-terminal domain-containing protein, partial [Eubacteriales bacterium]
MHSSFYSANRSRLYDSLPDGTLLAVFSGSHIRKTADEDYIFYADTNFLYLTGIEQVNSVLIAVKRSAGDVS